LKKRNEKKRNKNGEGEKRRIWKRAKAPIDYKNTDNKPKGEGGPKDGKQDYRKSKDMIGSTAANNGKVKPEQEGRPVPKREKKTVDNHREAKKKEQGNFLRKGGHLKRNEGGARVAPGAGHGWGDGEKKRVVTASLRGQ